MRWTFLKELSKTERSLHEMCRKKTNELLKSDTEIASDLFPNAPDALNQLKKCIE